MTELCQLEGHVLKWHLAYFGSKVGYFGNFFLDIDFKFVLTLINIKGGGGGVQGLKSWKHDFQKVHQLGQLFGRVLRPQTHKGTCGATPLFRAQKIDYSK